MPASYSSLQEKDYRKKMDSSLLLPLPKIFQRLMDHFLENQVIHSTIKFFMFQNHHVNTGSNAQ